MAKKTIESLRAALRAALLSGEDALRCVARLTPQSVHCATRPKPSRALKMNRRRLLTPKSSEKLAGALNHRRPACEP